MVRTDGVNIEVRKKKNKESSHLNLLVHTIIILDIVKRTSYL